MRNLLLLGLVLFAVWWLRRALLNWQAQRVQRSQARPPLAQPEAITACHHCGVHVPESEGVRDPAGHFYCTEAHRRLGSE